MPLKESPSPVLPAGPLLDPDRATGSSFGDFAVRVWDNPVTPFDRVMWVFVISCGYSEGVAYKYTLQIHTDGEAVCYWGSRDRCEEIVRDFGRIGVEAEVLEERRES